MTVFRKIRYLFLLFGIGAFLAACDGPEGPAGKDGINGAKGDPGAPGNANVIYSEWKTVTSNMWTQQSSGGLTRLQHDMTAPPLDQSVLDRGMVLVYVKLSQDNNQVRPLPYTIASAITQIRLEYSLLEKIVRIWSLDVYEGKSPPDGQYRYIIVPGGQAGRLADRPLSYEEAAALFNLPD